MGLLAASRRSEEARAWRWGERRGPRGAGVVDVRKGRRSSGRGVGELRKVRRSRS